MCSDHQHHLIRVEMEVTKREGEGKGDSGGREGERYIVKVEREEGKGGGRKGRMGQKEGREVMCYLNEYSSVYTLTSLERLHQHLLCIHTTHCWEDINKKLLI